MSSHWGVCLCSVGDSHELVYSDIVGFLLFRNPSERDIRICGCISLIDVVVIVWREVSRYEIVRVDSDGVMLWEY